MLEKECSKQEVYLESFFVCDVNFHSVPMSTKTRAVKTHILILLPKKGKPALRVTGINFADNIFETLRKIDPDLFSANEEDQHLADSDSDNDLGFLRDLIKTEPCETLHQQQQQLHERQSVSPKVPGSNRKVSGSSRERIQLRFVGGA